MRRRVKALILVFGFVTIAFVTRAVYLYTKNPLLESNLQSVNTQKISYQKLYEKNWQTIKNEYYDPSFNHQHWNRWHNRYQNKIKTKEDAKVAIETMLASLDDPYSRYLTAEEFAQQNNSITSKISGIGVSIVNDAGKIVVVNVIESTPAQFADVKSGDIIMAVDGKAVSGLSLAEVSNLVKGPINTFVNIDILRGNEKISKNIIRKEISIKTVKSSNDKNIGYIQITSFISKSTPNEFLEALENTSKTKGLIIDLRGNTGGLLNNAIFIANLFIDKGNLVSIVGRNGYKYNVEAQDTNVHIDKPIILLVDGASASASEILSGALKDYNRAKLVGTKTYGKGMVQKIISMPNETGLNLTIARYLTPSGNDINKRGITPNVEVKFTQEDIEQRKDVQLEYAKNMLNDILARNN
ncbi:S41 family peptidase [bacterium]|nr:S41 family peptidase [bacterium]